MVGVKDNDVAWNLENAYTELKTAESSTLSYTVNDKDGKVVTDRYYIYTGLKVYTPVTAATQDVSVYSAVGGMSTLVSPYPLDFSGDDMKAYTATVGGSTATFIRVQKVPAYTPILVKYSSVADNTTPVNFCNAADADDLSGTTNLLVAGTGAAVETTPTEGTTNFVLTTGDAGASYGFYYANGRTVATNRAYLSVPATLSRSLILKFDDETTGIDTVIGEGAIVINSDYFDLQGRRTAKPLKGLYIKNGKKIIIK